jgi:phosphatidylserine/phosphatidylglycerophosphate/cardiolipin synthase-like enzyme
VQSLVDKDELNNALSLEVHAAELQSATDTGSFAVRDVREQVRQNVEAMRTRAGTLPPPMDLARVPLHWVSAQLVVDRPGKISADDDAGDGDAKTKAENETVVDGMVSLMQGARRDVLLVTPYFVPGAQIMKTFEGLRQRGVRVRVLTNSLASNDAVAAHAGYARYRKALIRMGVELHELRGVALDGAGQVHSSSLMSGSGSGTRGAERSRVQQAPLVGSGDLASAAAGQPKRLSLHSKFVVIDGHVLLVGSMNLDLRSKLQNTEIGLLMASRRLSGQLTQLTELMFQRASYRVELDGEQLRWRAPPDAGFPDATREPEASFSLRMLANVISPLAPDELL